MMTQKHNSCKLQRSYFLTYLAVLIIPTIVVLICYNESYRIVRSNIENDHFSMLSQASEMMDIRIAELDSIGLQLVNSPQVAGLQYLEEPLAYPNIRHTVDAKATLPAYAMHNDFLFDYALFFNKGQLVLNDSSAYAYEDFYQLYMRPLSASYEEWLASIGDMQPVFSGRSVREVVYLREGMAEPHKLVELAYSFFPFAEKNGFAALYVSQESLLGLLPDAARLHDGTMFIQSGDRLILGAQTEDERVLLELQAAAGRGAGAYATTYQSIDGEEMMISRIVSPSTNLSIVSAMPVKQVFQRLTRLRDILLFALGFSVLLGGAASYLMSRRNARLIHSIAPGGGERLMNMNYADAFRCLRNSFSDIQTANTSMMDTLSRQRPYLQAAFLSRLLDGSYQNEEDAAAQAKSIGMNPAIKPLCVVLFRFLSGSRSNDTMAMQFSATCKSVIRLSLESMEPGAVSVDQSEENYTVLLAGDDLFRRADLLGKFVRSHLPESISEMLYIYVGHTVDALKEVVRSYDSAMSMIYIQPSPAEIPVLFHEASKSAKASLFYPQDMQHHLVKCMMDGDERGVLNLLATLKERNLGRADLPSFMRQLFIDNLLNTLLQTSSHSGLPGDVTDAICSGVNDLMRTPINAQLTMIDDLFLMVCRAVTRQKSGKQQSLVESITSYINSHYMDYDLSLAGVASHFGVSESYLSYAFKTQSGTNFFSFVENIRIENAKLLLRKTNQKISEIAAQVGYASANSFCRAFKRSTGDSASNYRNSM